MVEKTIKKVDNKAVDTEARKVLLNTDAWKAEGGVASVTITDKLVSQPRAKVGKQIQDLVHTYLPDSATTQNTTAEGVVVTVPEADLKTVRHAVRMNQSPDAFARDQERRAGLMGVSRAKAAAAAGEYLVAEPATGNGKETGQAAAASSAPAEPMDAITNGANGDGAVAPAGKPGRRRPADFRTSREDRGPEEIGSGKRVKRIDPNEWTR